MTVQLGFCWGCGERLKKNSEFINACNQKCWDIGWHKAPRMYTHAGYCSGNMFKPIGSSGCCCRIAAEYKRKMKEQKGS